jgi:hypothetical protein
MWTLLVIAAAMVWLMFFWTPGPEPAANVAFETPANEKQSLSHVVASPIPRLCSEHVWYGMTFHGYQDDYCISVAGKCHGLAGMVRAYFIRKKATVVQGWRIQGVGDLGLSARRARYPFRRWSTKGFRR